MSDSVVETLDNFGSDIDMNKTPQIEMPDESENSGILKEKNYQYIQWTNLGNGVFTHTGDTQQTLDSAAYSIFTNDRGIFLRKEIINSDDLIEFKDSIISNVLEEIEVFWDAKEVYKKYGFLHRRGYLFYGKAGCGKSGIIYLIINKIIKRNGIILICGKPRDLSEMVKVIRHIEPHRHIVVILEDIDAIIRDYGEGQVLSFLDGESQANDILNIATTNYPERLDKRIVARPRRFDRRLLIGPPSDSVRKEFFIKKLDVNEKEVEKWVSATDKFSFAGMTELVIQVKALNIDFEQAVKSIKNLISGATPTSDALNQTSVGFVKETG